MSEISAIGIIPARFGSTRYPGKPLVDIHGKSMIQRVYEQASKANFNKVVVATDDARIENAVKGFGGLVIMTSEHHTTGTERCEEAMSILNEEADVVINIQGDEPMVNPAHLNQLISCFENDLVDIATMICSVNERDSDDPNRIKVALRKDGRVLYFSRAAIPFYRNSDAAKTYFKHLGVYAYKASILPKIVQLSSTPLEVAESLEQLRWMENGYSIHAIEVEDESVSVDTPEDLERLKAIWKARMS